jgi:3-methyladenine DNA glycosylase AlkD
MDQKSLKKYHQELRKKLKALPKPSLKVAHMSARYVGSVGHEKRKPDEQSKHSFMGLKLPVLRALEFSFSQLAVKDQAKIWNYIWHNTKSYEEKWFALEFFSQKKVLSNLSNHWPILKTWVKDIDNWAHSDGLSSLYARVLETDHKKYFPFFEKLNSSKNPWERRQSIVSLYYYTRLRKQTIPAAVGLKMVENLIDDKHVFVQKGVGWTLREIYQVDEKAQVLFVKKNIHRIAPAGYYATVEKYPLKLKKEIKTLRMNK